MSMDRSPPYLAELLVKTQELIDAISAGATQYTEDAAAAANPIGTAINLIREDARAGSLTTTDGDNVALRGNNKGEAYVKDTDAGVSLAIIDDWDESDRAKVNPIAGQAGVAAGAGAVDALTQRATLASDDPAVTALQIIDDWDESDRAKVNLIVGQAGVAGGSGTVGATTQRVVLATDVGLPAGSALIGKVDHATTGIGHGIKTVTSAGTDEALASSTPAKWVMIQAQRDNTSAVAIGGSGVDAAEAAGTGIILGPGDIISLPCDNLADLFVDALVSGEGVRFTYGT